MAELSPPERRGRRAAAYTTNDSLDPSFSPGEADGDGKLTVELASPTNFDIIRGLAIQPDGKIVGAGSIESPDFGAIRLSQTGGLDPAFGGDGFVSSPFPNPTQRAAFGLVLQPDAKIVAAGGALIAQSGSDFLVARYGTDPPSTNPPVQQPPATTPAKKCKKGQKLVKGKCKKKKRKKKKKKR